MLVSSIVRSEQVFLSSLWYCGLLLAFTQWGVLGFWLTLVYWHLHNITICDSDITALEVNYGQFCNCHISGLIYPLSVRSFLNFSIKQKHVIFTFKRIWIKQRSRLESSCLKMYYFFWIAEHSRQTYYNYMFYLSKCSAFLIVSSLLRIC